jgi:hypothetical protein
VTGGMPLKVTVRPQPLLPHSLWHPGHDVSGFALPHVPAMICHLTIDPKQKYQLVNNWSLQNCEPGEKKNLLFELIGFGIVC